MVLYVHRSATALPDTYIHTHTHTLYYIATIEPHPYQDFSIFGLEEVKIKERIQVGASPYAYTANA